MTETLIRRRSAGVLLHPTSLSSSFGIGDVGPAAHAWIDELHRAGQSWWQVLPLGPTGYGDSPYQSFSAFAGNPNLISPELLFEEGLLSRSEMEGARSNAIRISFGEVIERKRALLGRAYERFTKGLSNIAGEELGRFTSEHARWLDDYALFMSLKAAFGGREWTLWDRPLVARETEALEAAAVSFESDIERYRFEQFLFFRQWKRLKDHANRVGIGIIGDIPIFVAADSADVWAHPDLFQLEPDRRTPRAVAGVPPDYFSETGQLWGNPVYDWDASTKTDYAWWVERMAAVLGRVDVARIDHFRGFEAYWEVPAGSPTAETGTWVKGPGSRLFSVVRQRLGRLPFIAEDLGVITPEVQALRKEFGFPGMRILQFAFAGAVEDRFLPHNYDVNTVVYTGTHDNDTTLGWYENATDAERRRLHRYVGTSCGEINWDLIRLGAASVGALAIVPLQDVLGLGTEGRMNVPGRPGGNWTWRLHPAIGLEGPMNRLGELTETYGRSSTAGASSNSEEE